MAFFDNKLWLLSHIRNSFICTDDTGMCETVMAGEDFPKQLPRITANDTYPGFDESSDDDDDMDLQESYDIQLNYFDNSTYRQRSNTAQHIEKMNIARKKAAKIKNIKWETSQISLTEEEKFELFSKKPYKSVVLKTKSLLSDQIAKTTNLPKNPFITYSKFDGSARIGVPTRKYKIFLTMLPENERNYPLYVCIIASARINDLIGLSCLKYSMTHPEYQFKSIAHYDLYITEDDGEMDKDFPPLDIRECVNKFSFNCLSLVEHKHQKNITFVPSDTQDTGPENDRPFKPSNQGSDDIECFGNYTGAILAPIYKCYRVFIITKVRAKIEVNLGVSGEQIDIDPVQQKNNKFWIRQKAVNYKIDNIAWCEKIDDSKNDRITFRLSYMVPPGNAELTVLETGNAPSLKQSPSFKHHDFETDKTTADEIVKKINHILELRSSTSRKNYLTIRERKASRRRSFHLVSKT